MFRLKLVTPLGVKFDDDVEMVIVRTLVGDRGILKGHRPLVAGLKEGTLRIKQNGEFRELKIDGGFIKVTEDGTSILTESVTE